VKLLPEIDPEVRGLLEEIVADPRSSIRLVPKKPLRSWFMSDERVRARDVSGTRAERHLIEAHREALAKLLLDAARIAYWKKPRFARTAYDDQWRPCDTPMAEDKWRTRAERWAETSANEALDKGLLASCLAGVSESQASDLARASLSLVPSDDTRYSVAVNLPVSSVRAAIRLLEVLASSVLSEFRRVRVLESLGARFASSGRERDAREAYRAARDEGLSSFLGPIYAFSLSCFLEEEESAHVDARELDLRVPKDAAVLHGAIPILADWWRDKRTAGHGPFMARLDGRIPEAAASLASAIA
jgi:hypothetical protein